MSLSFKQQYSFEKRFNESTRVRTRYPERIPIICERSKTQNSLPFMDKIKYLVPYDITIYQFLIVIRRRLSLKPEVALMVSIDDIIPSSIATMGELYSSHKYTDGFLYLEYSQENTFGTTFTFEKVEANP